MVFSGGALHTISIHGAFNILFGDDNAYSRRFPTIFHYKERSCAVADSDLGVFEDKFVVFSMQ